jgi:hypothetical protein
MVGIVITIPVGIVDIEKLSIRKLAVLAVEEMNPARPKVLLPISKGLMVLIIAVQRDHGKNSREKATECIVRRHFWSVS